MLAKTERVRAVLRAAARMADPADDLGRRARRELVATSGLSPEGIELGLSRCLETSASQAELARFVERAGDAPRVHVVLSPNVFVAPVRAVALAVAAAPHVYVRPSRREPVVPALLECAFADEFPAPAPIFVDAIAPRAGDRIDAYGRDETMAAIAKTLPKGARLRGYGAGFGVAVVDAANLVEGWSERLALDIAAFDQRGCLSPRLVVLGVDAEVRAEQLAREIAAALERTGRRIPRGHLTPDEAALGAVYRDSASAAGRLFAGDTWAVGLTHAPDAVLLGPPGRHIHCVAVRTPGEAAAIVAPFGPAITVIGGAAGAGDACDERCWASARDERGRDAHDEGHGHGTHPGCKGALKIVPRFEAAVRQIAPAARAAELGRMQSPPFDGPVDARKPLG